MRCWRVVPTGCIESSVRSANPQLILDQWAGEGAGAIRLSIAKQTSIAEKLAEERAAESQHFLDATFDDMERVAAAAAQMKLKLPKMSERAHARDRVAEYLKRVVTPLMSRRSHFELADRLLDARQSYRRGLMPDGKIIFRWDRKAGLPLLCPDDAREEAMRLSRRIVPNLMAQLRDGAEAHFCVLTWPNAQPGTLREVQAAIWKKFNSLMRACKRSDAPFPILGAVAVMESPLGAGRDWHPHLNVVFVTCGYFDYAKLRARWHWNLEIGKLHGTRQAIERSFRELVKYSCRAIPEKSDDAARRVRLDRDGNELPPAPAMIEWTAREFLEWWEAHRRRRRTRTYRSLYGLPKPTKLDVSFATWVAIGTREEHGYVERCALLGSIPGDKSTTENIRQRLKEAWLRLLGPPDHLIRVRQALETIKKHYGTVSLAV
jgi:hypothetical protein